MIERRAIPGYEGFYEITEDGDVFSLDRTILYVDGSSRRFYGCRLNPSARRDGYLQVTLRRGAGVHFKVHVLAALVFLGPRPEGMDIRHLNGNRTDNRAGNLSYGTRSENMKDAVAHGTHVMAQRTHCPQGHPYLGENLYVKPSDGGRECRICRAESVRRFYRKRLAGVVGP